MTVEPYLFSFPEWIPFSIAPPATVRLWDNLVSNSLELRQYRLLSRSLTWIRATAPRPRAIPFATVFRGSLFLHPFAEAGWHFPFTRSVSFTCFLFSAHLILFNRNFDGGYCFAN